MDKDLTYPTPGSIPGSIQSWSSHHDDFVDTDKTDQPKYPTPGSMPESIQSWSNHDFVDTDMTDHPKIPHLLLSPHTGSLFDPSLEYAELSHPWTPIQTATSSGSSLNSHDLSHDPANGR